MDLTAVFATVITLTAVLGFVNARFIKLPTTIGLMVAALVASLLLLAAGLVLPGIHDVAESLLEQIDFDDLLMQGMLSFLLFAGALHVNLGDLMERKWSIGLLATLGVTLSTFLIGSSTWLLFSALGIDLPYLWALLFGALISPTDPIAVLGLLKRAKTPKSLETLITGESLFNDGVGVVVFLMLLGFIGTGGQEVGLTGAVELFVVEALGGLALGFALGYVAYRMLKAIDDFVVEILITLALVAGGYTVASKLHMSGPLAMVVAGLMVGNQGRSFAMSDHTRENLDRFWELIDEILNAVLFVLIGLEVFVLDLNPTFLLAGVLTIPVVLASRFIACSVPITLLRPVRTFPPRTLTLLTWGGLRGGISVALALSLPASPYREPILEATYVVVVFAILVQGLTVGKVARGIEA